MIGTIALRTEVEDEAELNEYRDWLAPQLPGLVAWSAAIDSRTYILTCVRGKSVVGVEVDAESEEEARAAIADETLVVAHVAELP